MPTRGEAGFDARVHGIRMVGRAMEDTLLRSTRPLTPYEITVLVSQTPLFPKFTELWMNELRKRQAINDVGNTRFQEGIRQALWQEWVKTSHSPTASEHIFHALHAFFYPTAGVESYLLRHPYTFVKVHSVAGGTIVYSGPKGSGKTALLTSHLPHIDRLKQDHLENGPRSELAVFHRARSRFFRPLDDPSESDLDRAAVAEEPDDEPVERLSKGAKRPKKLDLYYARDVRFPTNISIGKSSSLGDHVQFGGRISDIVLDCFDNDEAGYHSVICIDEFGVGEANRRRSSTTGAWVIEQFVNTHRKFWSSLSVVAQNAEKQLSEDLVRNAQARFEKVSLDRPDEALITVEGLFRQQRFKDIPDTAVPFDTQSQASFYPDITLTTVWEYVASQQRVALQAEEEWDHFVELRVARAFIERNRATPAEMAAGKNGILRSEIRGYLEREDPNTPGQKYSEERVARIFAEELEQSWTEVLPKVQEVAKALREQRKAVVKGTEKPKSPEEIEDEYKAEKDDDSFVMPDLSG